MYDDCKKLVIIKKNIFILNNIIKINLKKYVLKIVFLVVTYNFCVEKSLGNKISTEVQHNFWFI